MPISIYRRHTTDCKRAAITARNANAGCNCRIHAEGNLGGFKIRESLNTRNWRKAETIQKEWNAADAKVPVSLPNSPSALPPVTPQAAIPTSGSTATNAEAWESFLANVKSNGRGKKVQANIHTVGKKAREFFRARGLTMMSDWTFSLVSQFRDSWRVTRKGTATFGKPVTPWTIHALLKSPFAGCSTMRWMPGGSPKTSPRSSNGRPRTAAGKTRPSAAPKWTLCTKPPRPSPARSCASQ